MDRPAVIAVDDEPTVVRAVERDLRRRYAERFRVLRTESGAGALELIDRVIGRGSTVALIVTDERMPGMTGVELLAAANRIVPEAKRVLLTAYADTDAAIRAINEVRLDHYLLKPWDPPEQHLYPVLDDLLADWEQTSRPTFDGITLIGHQWSPASHIVRDFLTRNLVPYRWLDTEDQAAGPMLRSAGTASDALPLVVLPDGEVLAAPALSALAARIGLETEVEAAVYDLVIVGGGPAGLAAAVYGASEGLRTVLVEGEAAGGQAGQSSRIENYLGFPAGLSGGDLARRATAQARRLGAELVTTQTAVGIEAKRRLRTIRLAGGDSVSCHAALIATGVTYRRLEAPGVEELTGAGVFYGAAASEARAVAGQDVVVVGGANSAGQAAVFFSRHACSVTILCRGESLAKGMSRYLVDQIAAIDNIVVRTNAEVEAVAGAGRLEEVAIRADGRGEAMRAAGLFIFIGAQPATGWLGDTVARTQAGFVCCGPEARKAQGPAPPWPLERDPLPLETNVPGVFAAGDVRDGSIKRVASAVGEGSMSVQLVHQYLRLR